MDFVREQIYHPPFQGKDRKILSGPNKVFVIVKTLNFILIFENVKIKTL